MISTIAINKTESSFYLYFSEFRERRSEKSILRFISFHNIITFVNLFYFLLWIHLYLIVKTTRRRLDFDFVELTKEQLII